MGALGLITFVGIVSQTLISASNPLCLNISGTFSQSHSDTTANKINDISFEMIRNIDNPMRGEVMKGKKTEKSGF